MAVTYNTTVRNNRLTQVVNAIDGGAGAGKLKIYTTGLGTLLATLTLNDPCGTVSAGVLTFDVDPAVTNTASASGTAAEATITDSNDTVVISGLTVSTSGANINISNTSITSGQTVTLTSGSITHAST